MKINFSVLLFKTPRQFFFLNIQSLDIATVTFTYKHQIDAPDSHNVRISYSV